MSAAEKTLIAAAPDMLAALEADDQADSAHMACSCFVTFQTCDVCHARFDAAAGQRWAAIAKAKGGAK